MPRPALQTPDAAVSFTPDRSTTLFRMGVFDRVEKKLEGAVNGVFARAFKGDVQPVEITARLQRELDAEAKLLTRERRLVPNDFTVQLSRHDHDRLAPYSKMLNSEVIPQLNEYAAGKGYIFNGPVTIDYELDESLAECDVHDGSGDHHPVQRPGDISRWRPLLDVAFAFGACHRSMIL